MAALDTNVLIGLLVDDDRARRAAATRLVRRTLSAGGSLFVPVTVALELEWVLRSKFGFGRHDVVRTLSQLLSARDLAFEREGALEAALVSYRRGSADFSDCLHVALAALAGERPFWTFDRAAAKIGGARLVAA